MDFSKTTSLRRTDINPQLVVLPSSQKVAPAPPFDLPPTHQKLLQTLERINAEQKHIIFSQQHIHPQTKEQALKRLGQIEKERTEIFQLLNSPKSLRELPVEAEIRIVQKTQPISLTEIQNDAFKGTSAILNSQNNTVYVSSTYKSVGGKQAEDFLRQETQALNQLTLKENLQGQKTNRILFPSLQSLEAPALNLQNTNFTVQTNQFPQNKNNAPSISIYSPKLYQGSPSYANLPQSFDKNKTSGSIFQNIFQYNKEHQASRQSIPIEKRPQQVFLKQENYGMLNNQSSLLNTNNVFSGSTSYSNIKTKLFREEASNMPKQRYVLQGNQYVANSANSNLKTINTFENLPLSESIVVKNEAQMFSRDFRSANKSTAYGIPVVFVDANKNNNKFNIFGQQVQAKSLTDERRIYSQTRALTKNIPVKNNSIVRTSTTTITLQPSATNAVQRKELPKTGEKIIAREPNPLLSQCSKSNLAVYTKSYERPNYNLKNKFAQQNQGLTNIGRTSQSVYAKGQIKNENRSSLFNGLGSSRTLNAKLGSEALQHESLRGVSLPSNKALVIKQNYVLGQDGKFKAVEQENIKKLLVENQIESNTKENLNNAVNLSTDLKEQVEFVFPPQTKTANFVQKIENESQENKKDELNKEIEVPLQIENKSEEKKQQENDQKDELNSELKSNESQKTISKAKTNSPSKNLTESNPQQDIEEEIKTEALRDSQNKSVELEEKENQEEIVGVLIVQETDEINEQEQTDS